MHSFLKIFKILTPKQLKTAIWLIVFMFFGAAMEALGIGLLYPLIAIIGKPNFLDSYPRIKEIAESFGLNDHRSLIMICALGLVIFYILKNMFILFQGKLQIAFSMNNQKDYTKRLYSYYMSKPYLFHVNTNISIISRNITNGGIIVFSEMLINTLSIISELITIVVIWVFLLIMDWFMAVVVAFVLGPLIFLILNFFRKKVATQGQIQNNCLIKVGKWINQGFFSVKETKVMQREGYFVSAFNEAYTVYADSSREFQFINRIPKAIIELVAIGGILLLVILKMLVHADPASIIPSLGVLALAAVRLMPSMNRIVGMFNAVKFKRPLFDEIFNDLIAVKELKDKDEKKLFQIQKDSLPFEKDIRVDHLSFAYPEKDKDVLSDVSFEIPKGKFVGIIGPSGAGKTTFVDILLGLLNPKSGEILVDGRNIHDNISSWLNNIAYVPQSIYLVDGSVRENIAFGISSEEIDDERIEKVLKMAELYDFVQSLPEKENTNVGDRGAKLSGGQRQRIGIARALYNNPNVLVLDEATSALDNETEKSITETILKLKGTITIIAIAHRLSTLESCDFKIKFENGQASIC